MAVGASASGADLGDFASRLRAMARGQETVDVAQLQFVGLSDIKQAYGDRWPDQKARIQDAAEAFLRKRINSSAKAVSSFSSARRRGRNRTPSPRN